jgi:TolB-like protein
MPILLMMAAGCSPRYHDMPAYWPIPTREYDNYGPGRFKTSYLAEQIDRYYRGSAPGPIGVTTFVNIDDLYTTSTFGRMVAEQLMSELSMKGFDVIELRHTDALQFLDSTGEFALSRDVRVVRPERNLAAVVVGTYVASPDRVYLNARLVDPSTSLVVSAGSVEMTKTRELAKLLRGGTIPASLERIPVRHLGYSSYPFNPFDPVRKRWDMEESDYGAVLPAPREMLQPIQPKPAPATRRSTARPTLESLADKEAAPAKDAEATSKSEE